MDSRLEGVGDEASLFGLFQQFVAAVGIRAGGEGQPGDDLEFGKEHGTLYTIQSAGHLTFEVVVGKLGSGGDGAKGQAEAVSNCGAEQIFGRPDIARATELLWRLRCELRNSGCAEANHTFGSASSGDNIVMRKIHLKLH